MIFSQKILNWFHYHGRKNLPWKIYKDPYSVWISEIMLQQTQVKTVIPYFIKFKKIFPNILKLSQSSIENVLYIWSGLGLYKRAFNLHKTAKIIQNVHKGIFPDTINEIIKLPGIGRSTAGAILSFCYNYYYPILDVNIKRILIRYYGFFLYSTKISILEKKLWNIINKILPIHQSSKFNQAMMDIGSMICINKNPKCYICPIKNKCLFYLNDKKDNFKIKKKKKFIKIMIFIIFKYKHYILLEKIKKENFWKNLFCFPMINFLISPKELDIFKKKYLNTDIEPFIHNISNIKLFIFPYLINNLFLKKKKTHNIIWFNLKKPQKIGLPKPTIFILKKIQKKYEKK